ncbi:KAPC-like protein [Mya arenaria]|uniref:KAPC-like protein n=1 Tax=Mya arenaria TaxID=6604 RepID=A0ABY7FP66_MYAAR|nr:putative 3-phosphoinositide-dependent protein kinase 2 [Mya arenaria]WAR22696.1 KAPC-like protein [Mya arenaria]
MSRKTGDKASVDAITTKLKQCATDLRTAESEPSMESDQNNGSFRYHIKRGKSAKLHKKLPSILKKKDKVEYYLVPIGSYMQSPQKTSPKWVDIASIIDQGIASHRNLNSNPSSKPDIRTTLSLGTLTSVLAKMHMYSVLPVSGHMTSLQTLLEKNAQTRQFAETHAKFVCVNLALALQFLHEKGVVHGSLRPRKVIFNNKGYPFLTGLGTADFHKQRPSRPRELLELAYTPSELLYDEIAEPHSDIFPMGCLVYAMIFGTPPHQGPDLAATRRNILSKTYLPPFAPDTISGPGHRFILRCIRRDEDRRFSLLRMDGPLSDYSSWFTGVPEEKLYRQTLPSPILPVIRALHTTPGEQETK